MEKSVHVTTGINVLNNLALEIDSLGKYPEFFIGNHNRYGEKIEGSWISKKQRITKNLIKNHLDRNQIIGSYYAYRGQGTVYCQYICLDIDFHKTPKSIALKGKIRKLYEYSTDYMEEVSLLMSENEIVVQKSLKMIEEIGIPPNSIVLEKSNRGFHIWILVKPRTTLKRARSLVEHLGDQIYSHFPTLEHIDLFPRQADLTKGGIGNFVKLPLIENLSKPLGDLVQCDIKEIVKLIRKTKSNVSKTIHLQKKRKSRAKNYKKPKIKDSDIVEFIPKLRPCIQEIVKGSRQASGENGHNMRMQVANELYREGASKQVRINSFRQQNDFDELITARQVNDLENRCFENKNTYLAQCKTIEKMGYCVPWCRKTGCTDSKEQYFQKLKESNQGITGGWEELAEIIANEVLISEKRSYIIKTTRSGVTTTIIKEGLKKNQKMLVIAPTLKIEETVKKASKMYEEINGRVPVIISIPENKKICKILVERIDREPELEKFPNLLKNDCNTCPYREIRSQGQFECKSMRISENIPHSDIIYITYSKLRAVQQSNKEFVRDLVESIRNHIEVIFLDEVSYILNESQTPIRLMAQSNGTRGFEDYNIADKFTSEVQMLQESSTFVEISAFLMEFLTKVGEELRRWIYEPDRIQDIDEEAANLRESFIFLEESFHILDYRKRFTLLDVGTFKKNAILLQSYLENYVNNGGDVHQTQTLRNIGNILYSEHFYLHLTFPQGYKRMLTLHFDSNITETLEYINTIADGKTLVCTDASEPPLEIEKIFPGIAKIIVNDPNDTASKQTIHPDRIKRNLSKGFEKHKNDLRIYLCTFSNEETMIIAQSKKIMFKALELCKEFSIPFAKMTYFRSSEAIGVECGYRRILTIGTSFGPKNAFYTSAYKYQKENLEKHEQTSILSEKLSYYDAKSAFFQAISRGKDPKGEEESEVYCFGMNTRTVRAMLNFNIATPKIGKHW